MYKKQLIIVALLCLLAFAAGCGRNQATLQSPTVSPTESPANIEEPAETPEPEEETPIRVGNDLGRGWQEIVDRMDNQQPHERIPHFTGMENMQLDVRTTPLRVSDDEYLMIQTFTNASNGRRINQMPPRMFVRVEDTVFNISEHHLLYLAGFREGDTLAYFNGYPVHTHDDLHEAMNARGLHQDIILTVRRGFNETVDIWMPTGF